MVFSQRLLSLAWSSELILLPPACSLLMKLEVMLGTDRVEVARFCVAALSSTRVFEKPGAPSVPMIVDLFFLWTWPCGADARVVVVFLLPCCLTFFSLKKFSKWIFLDHTGRWYRVVADRMTVVLLLCMQPSWCC